MKVAVVCFAQVTALLIISTLGYSQNVAAYSATGRETPWSIEAQSATKSIEAFFFACDKILWRLCVEGLRAYRLP